MGDSVCKWVNFDGDYFRTTYEWHIGYLQIMKQQNIGAYHKIIVRKLNSKPE